MNQHHLRDFNVGDTISFDFMSSFIALFDAATSDSQLSKLLSLVLVGG